MRRSKILRPSRRSGAGFHEPWYVRSDGETYRALGCEYQLYQSDRRLSTVGGPLTLAKIACPSSEYSYGNHAHSLKVPQKMSKRHRWLRGRQCHKAVPRGAASRSQHLTWQAEVFQTAGGQPGAAAEENCVASADVLQGLPFWLFKGDIDVEVAGDGDMDR